MKFRFAIFALAACLAANAQALPYTGLVVFGDSLSDAGNNAIVFDNQGAPLPPGTLRTAAPVVNQAFIPTFPYASNTYSNGPTWVQDLAGALGLPALTPSLAGGTDFAFGGARTSNAAFPFGLTQQVGMFLTATGGVAPASNLYVVAGGGNDARDALAGLVPLTTTISQYVANELSILNALLAAGARDILLVNVPDIGKTPAVRAANLVTPGASALGSAIAAAMNNALDAALSTLLLPPGGHLFELDAFALSNAVFANPAAFGLTDGSNACAASASCVASPDGNFFWDGIHPTAAGHRIIERAALAAIPEPASGLLCLMGLMMLGAVMHQRRALR